MPHAPTYIPVGLTHSILTAFCVFPEVSAIANKYLGPLSIDDRTAINRIGTDMVQANRAIVRDYNGEECRTGRTYWYIQTTRWSASHIYSHLAMWLDQLPDYMVVNNGLCKQLAAIYAELTVLFDERGAYAFDNFISTYELPIDTRQ